MSDTQVDVRTLVDIRTSRPQEIAERAAARSRPSSFVGPSGKLMVIAADHPARGALRAGEDAMAMADRATLLERMCIALSRPEVNGVLGTADILEDLLLLGALEGKVVVGSMNRGGLAGTCFEIDDRFTGYDADQIVAMGFDAGKMLLRIDPEDAATAPTIEACSRAVSELAARGVMAMVEPFISHRVDGRVRNDLSTEAVIRSVTVAAGLGSSSAYTWLKLPVTDDVPGWSRCSPPRRCRRCCSAVRSPTTPTRRSAPSSRSSSCRLPRASWWGARCSTRPTAMSPARSPGR